MKAMLEVLVRGLVDDPDAVDIKEKIEGSGRLYEVSVGPNDLGKVIGKEGRIANALRAVARALAARDGSEAHVEIMS